MTVDELTTPKRHLGIHLFWNVSHFGNPRLYATWKDEALNKTLKAACQQQSQATFEVRVLGHMTQLLRSDHERAGR